jgi:nonsense-mediated mRNA decay protein 3
MRVKFCPKCGKETEDFYEGLCKDCFLEKISFVKGLPDRIVINKCKYCNAFFLNEKDYDTLERGIEDFLGKLFKDENIKNVSYRIFDNKIHARIKSRTGSLEKTEEKIFNLIIKSKICKYCSLRLSKHFEAILQIRGNKNKKILHEIEEYVNVLYKHDKLAFISDIKEMPSGFNIFIGSKSAARNIVNDLKRKYKIKIKVSKKLYGARKGKKLYRDTILIEFGEI